LYAPGHEPPKAAQPAPQADGRKGPCPQERVVQGRNTTSPNS
jgi:hypothetical protein